MAMSRLPRQVGSSLLIPNMMARWAPLSVVRQLSGVRVCQDGSDDMSIVPDVNGSGTRARESGSTFADDVLD